MSDDEDYEIGVFEKKLIDSYKKRLEHITTLEKKVKSLNQQINKEKIDEIKMDYISAERELTEEEIKTQAQDEIKEKLDIEEDIELIRKQVEELPSGKIKADIVEFIDKIKLINNNKRKIDLINKAIKNKLKSLLVIISSERDAFERGINILISIEHKNYLDCNPEINLLIIDIDDIRDYLRREYFEVIGPISAFTEQIRKVPKFKAEDFDKMDLITIQNEIRKLNPIQAKVYLEQIERILNKLNLDSTETHFLRRFIQLFRFKKDRINLERSEEASRLYSQMEKNALLDNLTKLKNLRAYEQEGINKVKEKFRSGGKLTYVLFDLDHFKQINDTFGHEIGDDVLIAFANIVIAHIRPGIDEVYRVGGEEFCLLSTEDNLNKLNALHMIDHIRMSVTNGIEELKKNGSLQLLDRIVTVSAGVAIYSFQKNNLVINSKEIKKILKSLKAKADKLLYKSKDKGRNQTTIIEMDYENE